ERRERIARARADGAGRADDEERQASRRGVSLDLALERVRPNALVRIRLDPTNGHGADAGEVRGLLDPRMRFPRRVYGQPAPVAVEPVLAHVPRSPRAPGCDESENIRHVSAARKDTAARKREPDQLREPAHRLRLDLA